jgi:multiple sugar transport system permease protein
VNKQLIVEDRHMVGSRSFARTGWLAFFLLPGLLGLLAFTILPLIASLVLTLFQWDLLTPPQFVGFDNFVKLSQDRNFWSALQHTLAFIAGYLPLVMILALGMALALNAPLRGIAFIRTAFFLPVVSSWVAVALLWSWLFDAKWAMPAIILTSVWKDLGFVLVLFLAGLQAIPQDYYEAAALDGASRFRQLTAITLPLLAPTTFFVTIISLINSFQVFDQVWVMTAGGPAGATTVLVEQVVKNAFSYGQMGYASAMSWVLFAIVFVVTLVQFRWQRKGAADA